MAENTNNGEETQPGHIIVDIWESWESECSDLIIYKIPRKLRDVNKSAYTPQLVSIGPYHHGSEKLSEMESLKSKYQKSFLKRFENFENSKKESDWVDFIHGYYKRLRKSYEGNIPAELENDGELFVKMILKDACFILELFLRSINYGEEGVRRDCILRTPWLRKAIKLDLILLENQLPFFIVKKIYKLVKNYLPPVVIPKPKYTTATDPRKSCGCFCLNTSLTCCQVEKSSSKPDQIAADNQEDGGNDPLLLLTRFFFEEHYLTETCRRVKVQDIRDIKHFTDLLRKFWLPREFISKKNPHQDNIADRKYLYSATKLDRAGVTFEPARKGTCLTDVKISKKKIILKFIPIIKGMRLKLPELKLENDTESLLRNVMALEQCLYPDEDYICGYVALMDQLINTGEDVEFLVDRKILTNLLGSNKEAAKLINGLCNQIPREKSYYATYYNELNTFYENRWNVTRATLKKVYFKDLWTGSSTVVGLFVLLFTVSATLKNVYFRHL